MYKVKIQLELSDFVFPYGTLDENNEWIKLSKIIPWDEIEESYLKNFTDNGAPAHSARIALGALIVKQRLRCSDVQTVKHVSENPYIQFFLGAKEYTSTCPFGASTMVDFRKRFSSDDMQTIIESVIPKETPDRNDNSDKGDKSDKNDDSDKGDKSDKNDDSDKNDTPNTPDEKEQHPAVPLNGTLLLDATCCPSNIAYPQDSRLLEEARAKLQDIIDELCKEYHLKKPRSRKNQARRAYTVFSKAKKHSRKSIRAFIGKHLNYVYRNIEFIANMIDQGAQITEKQAEAMNIITTLYEQQRTMHETNSNSIKNRIVSLSQHWVRPIVRGKAHAKTEFGAKLHMSVVDGYARIERIQYENFNEAVDFYHAVERYRKCYGCYPERILADKLYRNRETLQFCKEHGIRLSGPALGRPKKDSEQTKQSKKDEYQDMCDRNEIEGRFGTGKTRYGLSCIAAKLEETTLTVIGVALLCLNLDKRLKTLLRFFAKCVLSRLYALDNLFFAY